MPRTPNPNAAHRSETATHRDGTHTAHWSPRETAPHTPRSTTDVVHPGHQPTTHDSRRDSLTSKQKTGANAGLPIPPPIHIFVDFPSITVIHFVPSCDISNLYV